MDEKPKPKADNPEQFARFLEAADKAQVDPKELERAVSKIIPPKTANERPH